MWPFKKKQKYNISYIAYIILAYGMHNRIMSIDKREELGGRLDKIWFSFSEREQKIISDIIIDVNASGINTQNISQVIDYLQKNYPA